MRLPNQGYDGRAAVDQRGEGVGCLWSRKTDELASAEGDDAANGVIGRDADGHPVARDNLDAEPTHSPAQLGQNLMARIDLHPIQAAAVHGHDGPLDIN
jgi:hypothetical protein